MANSRGTNPSDNTAPAAGKELLEVLEALATPGLGPVIVRRLLTRFGSLAKVRSARDEEFEGLGLKRSGLRALREGERRFDPAEEVGKARALGVEIIPFTDPRYPKALAPYEDAPAALYLKGEIQERDVVAIAIVGVRRASLYGKMHAERFAFELAQAGFTIVSGLAVGIDAAAHEGALKGRGRTLAVLGNGLASVYPPENRDLAERIASDGALLSELPLDTPPVAANFPPRNRIIAGMALGVLVVEAARSSGALITARLAGEMGKEVFAVPGDIGRPQTRGVHRLIRDGAKLVETVEDVLEELGPLDRPVMVRENETPIPDPRALLLNPQERMVYDLLDSSPRSIDDVTQAARLSPANAASTLMVLELKRLAVQLPGQLYVRAGSYIAPRG